MNMMTKPAKPFNLTDRLHQIRLNLGGAEVGTDRVRTILEILLEEEEVCTNARLGELIGAALDQLEQVNKSVSQTLTVAACDRAS